MELKYDKELYTDCGFYDEASRDDISCYKQKLVKCRKPHKCNACGKEIPIGSYAIYESGFMDGKAVSCYTCARCIEGWLEESRQVDAEEEKRIKSENTVNRFGIIKEEDSQEFLREFNNNKVSKEFLDSCKKAGKLFDSHG